jgi:hypothetical protein
MQSISRCSESKFLDSIIEEEIEKQSAYFDRINFGGSPKKDPFEDIEMDDIWRIHNGKLLKKKEVIGEKK